MDQALAEAAIALPEIASDELVWNLERESTDRVVEALEACAIRFEEVDEQLRGRVEALRLAVDEDWAARVAGFAGGHHESLLRLEAEAVRLETTKPGVRRVLASIRRLRDAAWSIERDRVEAARGVRALAAGSRDVRVLDALGAVSQVLRAIDRLEVRGRDSAGIAIFVEHPGVDLESPETAQALTERGDPLLRDGAVRVANGQLVFVYKTAAEIGELGDNVAQIRASIMGDELLRQALSKDAEVRVLSHTRWASVGLINQPNAHPADALEQGRAHGGARMAVLNGDVDNHLALIADHGLEIAPEITNDAKVIPVVWQRLAERGSGDGDAFLDTVARFEGSVAIAGASADEPDCLQLALRGSGQALYVGLGEGAFLVASEPYGLVEQTASYLRLDGETPADPTNPAASRGQVMELRASAAGTLGGVQRWSYDGRELPVSADEVRELEITTRDIDRGDHAHFLVKEIHESPDSFEKTLRGRLHREADGSLAVALRESALSPALVERLGAGAIRRVFVIGQGTAAVAGSGVARAFGELLPADVSVEALPATELSGFGLKADMSDTLVVAISQSGTTTDTNRTVDLVRGRGAVVVSIVNRRHSDLTDKSDGVLYTSDGRDVEMSVASTKAFYSQIAAGFLLAVAIAEVCGRDGDSAGVRQEGLTAELLEGLIAMPDALRRCLSLGPEIARIAEAVAPPRRYWALVGNGWNVVAAEEIRIKLSELCYKSIACDVTEDKKHIDLSSEPLILVCGAGLSGSNADDVAKEVAIYRAHKALPVVIASEGDERWQGLPHKILVPRVHPALDFVLAVMAGHLFGYHAALAIDRLAQPLRTMREGIERTTSTVSTSDDLLERLAAEIEGPAASFFASLAAGRHNGHLEASTAGRISTALHGALGRLPLEAFALVGGTTDTPSALVEALVEALTRGIDELTRPVDAIKHQAKTVTVGISRSEEGLLTVPLVASVIEAGALRDRLSYAELRTLAALDPLVEEVTGSTHYRLKGDPEDDACETVVLSRLGIAAEIPSRVERDPLLRGTKRRVATERRVLAALGRSDGRSVLIVPEIEGQRSVGLVLMHVRYRESVSRDVLRRALEGYRHRYASLRDAVMETEPVFREDRLDEIAIERLVCEPVSALAEEWREE